MKSPHSPKKTAESATAPCGPDYIVDGPGYAELLARKKADMKKNGLPDELVALLDRDGRCVARVRQAPDWVSLKIVAPEGSRTMPWSKADEELARRNLADGKITAFYNFNTNRAFGCCDEPRYDARTDWDPKLDLNLGLAICCKFERGQIVCR